MASILLQKGYCMGAMANLLSQLEIIPKQWPTFNCKWILYGINGQHSNTTLYYIEAMTNIPLQMHVVLKE